MVDPAAIMDAIYAFTDFLMRYGIALAAVGALSMALIEAWKKLFDTRTKYHLRAVLAWMGGPEAASYAQLVHLTTGSPLPAPEAAARHARLAHTHRPMPRDFELALFTLELERMMGHVQDAADAALRDPARYGALYRFVASGAAESDVKEWERAAYTVDAGKEDAAKRAALYARVHTAAKGKLDAFQLYTTHRWANMNQLVANAVGAVVLFLAMVWTQLIANAGELSAATLLLVLPLSLLGGVLAPIAKDLVVALKRVRSGG